MHALIHVRKKEHGDLDLSALGESMTRHRGQCQSPHQDSPWVPLSYSLSNACGRKEPVLRKERTDVYKSVQESSSSLQVPAFETGVEL
jgi:hypothetical protein